MRHLEAFQLPSLQFWLISKIVRAVLVFRLSESSFAFLPSLFCVGSDISSSRSSSTSSSSAVRDGSAPSEIHRRSLVVSERMLQEVKNV